MFCTNPDCPDFVESGRPAEFVVGITVCPKCGEYLTDMPPAGSDFQPPEIPSPAEAPAPSPDTDFEPVFESWDPTEVPVVKSMLDAAGIPYLTRGEEQFDALRGGRSAMRFNPRGGSVFFWVPTHLADDARALLEEVDTEE
jgi:hypothetical protein